MENPTEKQIVRRAYELWEQAGKPEGRDQSFIIWPNKNYVMRINPHHCVPRTICKKNCRVCFGIGWVCENHPDRAWHEELGCIVRCRNAPCKCNSGEELDVSQVLVDEKDATRH
jgi:Protein of unknown function (DUF2934)